MLGAYAANRGASCERPFGAWLLVQGVIGVLLGVYGAVLVTKVWFQDSCGGGAARVSPIGRGAAAPPRPHVADGGKADGVSELRWCVCARACACLRVEGV